MVVTRLHAIEHRALQLDAERRALGLVDAHTAFEPAAPELELDERGVDVHLILDDVAHRFAVDARDLVARAHAGPVGRRSGRDRLHTSAEHGARIRPR